MKIDTLLQYNDFTKSLELDWSLSLGEITEKILQVCHLLIYNVEKIHFNNPSSGEECIFGDDSCKFTNPLPEKYLDKTDLVKIIVYDRERDEHGNVKPENKYAQAFALYQQEKSDLELAKSMQNDITRYNAMGNLFDMLFPPLPNNENTVNSMESDDDSERTEEIEGEEPPPPEQEDNNEQPHVSELNNIQEAIQVIAQWRNVLSQPISWAQEENVEENMEENEDEGDDENSNEQIHEHHHHHILGNVHTFTNQQDMNNFLNNLPPGTTAHTYNFNINDLIGGNFQNAIQGLIQGLIPQNLPDSVKLILTDEDLAKLNVYSWEDYQKMSEFQNSNYQSNTCNICLDEYEPKDQLMVLTCDDKHYYHQDCIRKWLTENSNKCPICKKEIAEGRPNEEIE